MTSNSEGSEIKINDTGDYSWMSVDNKYEFIVGVYNYWSIHQYMMCQKAILNSDIDSFTELIYAHNINTVDAIAKSIRIDDEIKWESFMRSILTRAVYNKFTKEEHIMNLLLNTGDKSIVDCTRYKDVYSGNMLGVTLEKVRKQIRSEIDLGINVIGAWKYNEGR